MLGPVIQEIVTHLSPVEAVATEINFLICAKSGLDHLIILF